MVLDQRRLTAESKALQQIRMRVEKMEQGEALAIIESHTELQHLLDRIPLTKSQRCEVDDLLHTIQLAFYKHGEEIER